MLWSIMNSPHISRCCIKPFIMHNTTTETPTQAHAPPPEWLLAVILVPSMTGSLWLSNSDSHTMWPRQRSHSYILPVWDIFSSHICACTCAWRHEDMLCVYVCVCVWLHVLAACKGQRSDLTYKNHTYSSFDLFFSPRLVPYWLMQNYALFGFVTSHG